eukprot:TRINITY_DN325_c0_g1_i2.p1 TRINITY_DN325_c0_g1~~TRINITY_DN325_c0_g1_i2.p1  ORF type:complete len:343 (-),score=84.07 TRINITY_DN325_c0_g1_i2:387-1415(-)
MSSSGYNPVASQVGAGEDTSAIELADVEAVAEGEKAASAPAAAPAKEDPTSSLTAVGFGVALYAFCSSTLLVINKVSVHLIPDPSFVLFCQFLASSVAVRSIKVIYPDTDIEFLKWEKAKPFFAATLIFYICLFTNTAALKHVNVETVIVVRSCSPIAVALLEKVTLGKDLPNIYGCGALLVLAGGATLYVLTDDGFQVQGYMWLAAYFVSIVIEMVFVKFIVETIPMSTWTRVYYNNTLSLPLAAFTCVWQGSKFLEVTWSAGSMAAIWLSCIVGVAISYAGFNLRKLVSATTFTVVGVVCKIITVFINDVIWTQHSNALGHVGLGICIFAGWLYEKAKKW